MFCVIDFKAFWVSIKTVKFHFRQANDMTPEYIFIRLIKDCSGRILSKALIKGCYDIIIMKDLPVDKTSRSYEVIS